METTTIPFEVLFSVWWENVDSYMNFGQKVMSFQYVGQTSCVSCLEKCAWMYYSKCRGPDLYYTVIGRRSFAGSDCSVEGCVLLSTQVDDF